MYTGVCWLTGGGGDGGGGGGSGGGGGGGGILTQNTPGRIVGGEEAPLCSCSSPRLQ